MITICETGIHVGQMKIMIAHADETLALAQKWLEQIHHLADHGDFKASSTAVAQATVLLGEARAKLETSIKELDSDTDPAFSVERV